MRGFINRFDRQRGFGFITDSDGNEVFFHIKDIIKKIFSVEFDVEKTDKGLKAINVNRPRENDG